MNLARVAWDENNLARTRELLDKYRPRPSESDLRGFEWHYLNRCLHGDELIVKAHEGWVSAVTFMPDGKRLLTSGTDQPPQGMKFFEGATGQVKLWDVATGKQLRFHLNGLTTRLERAILSPDGTHLAATSWDHAIRVWDLVTDELVTLEGPAKYNAEGIRFSPDGMHLVSVHRPDNSPMDSLASIKIWDLSTRKAVLTLSDTLPYREEPTFSPDGKYLAAAVRDVCVVKVWDAATGAELYSCKYADGKGRVNSATFSPDGKRLAACGEKGIQIWDTATHEAVAMWRSDPGYGICLAFSPDGQRLALGRIEGIVEVWDTGMGQKVHTFKGHSGNVRRLAFSPDGKRLVTGGADGSLRVWDMVGRRDIVLIGKPDDVLDFPDLSPDGQTLRTGRYWSSGKLAAVGRHIW
jgi:WD40 repeat protein